MPTFALQPQSNEIAFNLQDLLQELLLALVGCTGDVFVNSSPSSRQEHEGLRRQVASTKLVTTVFIVSSAV